MAESGGLRGFRPAVFLDRDGTINVDKGYVHRIDQWEWIPNVVPAMRSLVAAGFSLVVVTNQAGVARQLYGETDCDRLHQWMEEQLAHQGISLTGVFHCPHHPDFGTNRRCNCRKPRPGMLTRAATELSLDLSRSWMVGDKVSDVEAGIAAGVRPLLVLTGHGATARRLVPASCAIVSDLGAAAAHILCQVDGTP